MKKFIVFIITAIILAVATTSCYNPSSTQKDSYASQHAREQFVKDSMARVQFVRDSIAMAKKAEELKPLFTQNTDEFNGITWVELKTAPKYRNQNGCYLYFANDKNEIRNLRFVYQYCAYDWLFINKLFFKCDDKIHTIVPRDMKRDCGYGGMIWEWCDLLADENVIKDIISATQVKVKLEGDNYTKVKELTTKEIDGIKKTYEYYTALGGKFPI